METVSLASSRRGRRAECPLAADRAALRWQSMTRLETLPQGRPIRGQCGERIACGGDASGLPRKLATGAILHHERI
jgi:hypothetical protein